MSNAYFILPYNDNPETDGSSESPWGKKYQPLCDSAGRCLSSIVSETRTSSHKLLCVNEKFLGTLLDNWEVDIFTARRFKNSFGLKLAGDGDYIYWWPEDFVGERNSVINLSSYTVPQSIRRIAHDHEAVIMLLPEMVSVSSYASLPKINNMAYIVPVVVRNKNIVASTVVSGAMSFGYFNKEWIDYIPKPADAYFFVSNTDTEAIVAMQGRPDIMLMPTIKFYEAAEEATRFDNMFQYALMRYMSCIVGEDLIELEIVQAAEAEWNEKLESILRSNKSDETRMAITRILCSIETTMQDLARYQMELEVEKRRLNILQPKGCKGLKDEKKLLRGLGCYIDSNKIVYPMKNVVVETGGNYYKIGDIEITIAEGMTVAFIAVRMASGAVKYNKAAVNPHPNVNTSGGICLGNGAKDVTDALNSGNISTAFMLISALLCNYGTPPHCDISNWPLCTPDGTLLTDIPVSKGGSTDGEDQNQESEQEPVGGADAQGASEQEDQ